MTLGVRRAASTPDRARSQVAAAFERGRLYARSARRSRHRYGMHPSRLFSRGLYEETEGNPFFVEEIIRHLESELRSAQDNAQAMFEDRTSQFESFGETGTSAS